MNCLVTAGPTFEPLDKVRRLTNFSTGRLGTELANYLADRGHRVTLLIGEQATWAGLRRAPVVAAFSTGTDLQERLRTLADPTMHAVFHAAAVGDFAFGRVWQRTADGGEAEVKSGKLATREGPLLAELIPTPKILQLLRDWFPRARIVGWKFEVDGARAAVLELARRQLAETRTDACVANGPAYGGGFGLVTAAGHQHLADATALFAACELLGGELRSGDGFA